MQVNLLLPPVNKACMWWWWWNFFMIQTRSMRKIPLYEGYKCSVSQLANWRDCTGCWQQYTKRTLIYLFLFLISQRLCPESTHLYWECLWNVNASVFNFSVKSLKFSDTNHPVCSVFYVCCSLHACDTFVYNILYHRKFWRGIYFGGLGVLRAIRQYFIRQKAAQCDVMLLQNHINVY